MKIQSFLQSAFIAVALYHAPSFANAAWFARLDSAGALVVTGITKDNDDVSSTVTLTCDNGKLSIEVLTRHVAEQDDLPLYAGVKIAISYKIKGGEVRKVGLEASPRLSAGGGLIIAGELSPEQSRSIYESIARGYRFDVELLHPELIHDIGVKKIFSENFVQAALSIHDYCTGFR